MLHILDLVSRMPHSLFSSSITGHSFSISYTGSSFFPTFYLMLEESQLSPWSSILLYQHSLIWSHDSKYPLYILTPKFLYPAQTSFLHFRILHPQWPTPHSHSENHQKQNSASSLKQELLSFPSDVSLLAKRASL